MGWWIALAVIVLLAVLPLGASVRYEETGFSAWLLIGPGKLRLYPAKKKEKPEKPEKKKQPAKQPPAESETAKQARKKADRMLAPKGGSWTDFLPLVRVGLDFLGDLRRKIRVRDLELQLMMAGDDPCDLAVNYGRANAAMGALLAGLDRAFVIKKQKVRIDCDFAAEEMTVYARLDVTLTVARALSLAVRYGVRGLREYLNLTKKRKGGASL